MGPPYKRVIKERVRERRERRKEVIIILIIIYFIYYLLSLTSFPPRKEVPGERIRTIMLIAAHPWDDPDVPWLEEDLQAAVATSLFRVRRAGYPFDYAGDGTGGGVGRGEGSRRKAMGVTAGEPDFRVYLPAGRLWLIEFKRRDGTLNPEQKARHPKLAALGHPVPLIRAATPMEAVEKVLTGLADRLGCEYGELVQIARMRGNSRP